MKSILLVDVDSQKKVGNIAIRKLHTYYNNKGYNVEIKRLFYSGYPSKKHEPITIDANGYDEVWVSIIFIINKDMVKIINCDRVFFGGTGYDKTIKLPQEIDDCEQDYSAYPDVKESTEFITRGCIRDCWFCFVRQKEGYLHQYRTLDQILENYNAGKIRFFDNNFLAWDKANEVMKILIKKQIPVSFNEGLDIRLITEENAMLLSELNYYPNEYVFAFDDLKYVGMINEKVKIIKKYITGDWKLKFYVYTHPDMQVNDILTRVHWCRDRKFLPYIMRDESCYYHKNNNFYTDLTAWCNQPRLFKKLSFEEVLIKRSKNNKRIEQSKRMYQDNIK